MKKLSIRLYLCYIIIFKSISIEKQEELSSNKEDESIVDYNFKGKKLLIVEDNEINMEIEKSMAAGMNDHN